MALSREKLVNIQVFMARAVEANGVRSVNDAMSFAETMADVQEEINKIDETAKPLRAPTFGDGIDGLVQS